MSAPLPMVHLVDDDASFLRATSRLLRASGFAVSLYSSAQEFLNRPPDNEPGCVIADLQMPGLSGLDLQEALARTEQSMPVIFLTGQGDIPTSVRAMRDGAEDFLEKCAPKEKILAAVHRAHARAARESKARAHLRGLRARLDTLSAREREVLGHVVQGKMNKQIAADLHICERTVKVHRTSITTKLCVASVAELTRLVQEAGLIQKSPGTFPKGQ